MQKQLDKQKETENNLVISYMALRNFIGISGGLLPFVLATITFREKTDSFFEPSISDYYYTSSGDIFVVILCTIAVFLLTYSGYEWREKALTSIAALAAYAVAFNPTRAKGSGYATVHFLKYNVPMIGKLEFHLIFAVIFFLCAALMSLIYFPKTKADKRTTEWKRSRKAKRNIIYYVCGWLIIFSLLCLVIYFSFFKNASALKNIPVIFIFETIAVLAFSISWLTKGETLLPDGEHYVVKAFKIAKNKFRQ